MCEDEKAFSSEEENSEDDVPIEKIQDGKEDIKRNTEYDYISDKWCYEKVYITDKKLYISSTRGLFDDILEYFNNGIGVEIYFESLDDISTMVSKIKNRGVRFIEDYDEMKKELVETFSNVELIKSNKVGLETIENKKAIVVDFDITKIIEKYKVLNKDLYVSIYGKQQNINNFIEIARIKIKTQEDFLNSTNIPIYSKIFYNKPLRNKRKK